jgi:hypothetical protein
VPAPLSLAALHHVIGSRLGKTFAWPTLKRIAEVSGGNPFFALEIARPLACDRDDSDADWPLPIPPGVQRLAGRARQGAVGRRPGGRPDRRFAVASDPRGRRRRAAGRRRAHGAGRAENAGVLMTERGAACASRTRCSRPPSMV